MVVESKGIREGRTDVRPLISSALRECGSRVPQEATAD
jgi:hypothetical protein